MKRYTLYFGDDTELYRAVVKWKKTQGIGLNEAFRRLLAKALETEKDSGQRLKYLEDRFNRLEMLLKNKGFEI